MPLYKHMVPWSSASFSAVLRHHVQVSEFSVHLSLYFPFQLYLHPLHTEGNIWRYFWFGLFYRRTRCQIEKGLTAGVRLPAIMIDRRAKARLKGEKVQALRLHLEGNRCIRSYKLYSKCKPKWQRQANEFLRWNLSSNNIRELSRHHILLLMTKSPFWPIRMENC